MPDQVAATINPNFPNRLALICSLLGPFVNADRKFDPRRDVEVYVDGSKIEVSTFSFDVAKNRYLLFAQKPFDPAAIVQVVHHIPASAFGTDPAAAPSAIPTGTLGGFAVVATVDFDWEIVPVVALSAPASVGSGVDLQFAWTAVGVEQVRITEPETSFDSGLIPAINLSGYVLKVGGFSTAGAADPLSDRILTFTVTGYDDLEEPVAVAIRSVTILLPPNVDPVLTIGVNSNRVYVPFTVTFSASATDLDGIAGYLWDFGDGTSTSVLQNPTHAYTVAGSYTATCVATDNRGGTDTKTLAITALADGNSLAQKCTNVINGIVASYDSIKVAPNYLGGQLLAGRQWFPNALGSAGAATTIDAVIETADADGNAFGWTGRYDSYYDGVKHFKPSTGTVESAHVSTTYITTPGAGNPLRSLKVWPRGLTQTQGLVVLMDYSVIPWVKRATWYATPDGSHSYYVWACVVDSTSDKNCWTHALKVGTAGTGNPVYLTKQRLNQSFAISPFNRTPDGTWQIGTDASVYPTERFCYCPVDNTLVFQLSNGTFRKWDCALGDWAAAAVSVGTSPTLFPKATWYEDGQTLTDDGRFVISYTNGAGHAAIGFVDAASLTITESHDLTKFKFIDATAIPTTYTMLFYDQVANRLWGGVTGPDRIVGIPL